MLSGKLLQFVPLMSKDSLYMLSLPDNPAYHQFPLPCRLKLKSCALPDLQGVCLPEESTFLSVNMQKPGFLNLKADSYNVSDKILHEEVGQKELINVEGIISYRLHTNVKYDSEKKYIPGYGVPGMKNIVLKLDSTLACGEEISLYLSKWNFRAYPLGLVPGAQIRAMFVAKHTSYNSFHTYLQATELTAIEVLSVPQQMGLEIFHETCSTTSHDWGESCILTHQAEHAAAGSTLWGCVSMLKILKLTVVTSCTHCSSVFKSGCCVGCSTYPLSSKLSVSATSCMEDIFGKILIFMKDEQVHQYLGLSKQYWDVLTKLVSRDGSKIELPQNQWNSHDPIGKRVLQALVKAADKQQPRFHILCRKMKVNKEVTVRAMVVDPPRQIGQRIRARQREVPGLHVWDLK
ncbi:uncharacterized protein LOC110832922 isoform X2 [Zootermopsis nevadensis]|nr:uncharacterized protein LOC110832922 isoform X2 [Zootermopsis nevadensis]